MAAQYIVGKGSNGLDNALAVELDGSLNVASTATDANGVGSYYLDGYNKEIQTDATYTYNAYAVSGTALATAAWRAERVTTATGTRVFADGGAFSQVGTSLAALTYAY